MFSILLVVVVLQLLQLIHIIILTDIQLQFLYNYAPLWRYFHHSISLQCINKVLKVTKNNSLNSNVVDTALYIRLVFGQLDVLCLPVVSTHAETTSTRSCILWVTKYLHSLQFTWKYLFTNMCFWHLTPPFSFRWELKENLWVIGQSAILSLKC